MAAKKKPDNLEAFRLMKRDRTLAKAEHVAGLAVADACSMREGVCRKSIATLAAEYGVSVRHIEYGLHGRPRKNGEWYFTGLIKKGIVFVIEGGRKEDGVPTTYGINLEVLRTRVNGTDTSAQTSAQPAEEPLHNSSGTSAQTSAQNHADLCTTAADLCTNLRTNADKVLSSSVEGSKNSSLGERESSESIPPAAVTKNQSLSPSLDSCEKSSTEKPSTKITKISAEEAVIYIIKTVQMRNSAAAFNGGSNKKLGDALKQLGHATYWELDTVVTKVLAGCDEFMLRNFGSRLAAQLIGAVQALRARQKKQNEQREAARPMDDWRADLTSEARYSDVDLDEWLKENPVPGDNPHWGKYYVSEAKRERADRNAKRARWREAFHKHLREDDDYGLAWLNGQPEQEQVFWQQEEDTITADIDKERARRAGEKARASA
jgi:hypothetical protein